LVAARLVRHLGGDVLERGGRAIVPATLDAIAEG
jgi:hypothetical protein